MTTIKIGIYMHFSFCITLKNLNAMSASRKRTNENRQNLIKLQNIFDARLREFDKVKSGILADKRTTAKKLDEAIKAGSATTKMLATELIKLDDQISEIESHCSNIRLLKNSISMKNMKEETLMDIKALNEILAGMTLTDQKEVQNVLNKTERLMTASSNGEKLIGASLTSVTTGDINTDEVSKLVDERVKNNDEEMLVLLGSLPNIPQKQTPNISVETKQNNTSAKE
jgi:hypothetical protein